MKTESTKIILACVRALLGNVTHNLKKVFVKYSDQSIIILMVYYTDPSELEIDLSEEVVTELFADFSSEIEVNCKRYVKEVPQNEIENCISIFSRFESELS